MKTKFFNSITCLSFLFLTVFTIVGCGGDEDDAGTNSRTNSLSDYLTVKNVSAHYIGDVIVADFQLENKSKKDINDLILQTTGEIYSGNTYTAFISAGEGTPFMGSLNNFSIARGETRNVRVKLVGASLQAGVNKAKIELTGYSNQIGNLTENRILFTAPVNDPRGSKNCIWTNDDKLEYGEPVIKRSGDNLFVTFSITNKTGINLPKVYLESDYQLDNGNGQRFTCYVSVDDDTQAHWSLNFTINSGETRMLTVYVPDFYKYSARCVNAKLKMDSEYYYFANEALYLVSVEL